MSERLQTELGDQERMMPIRGDITRPSLEK